MTNRVRSLPRETCGRVEDFPPCPWCGEDPGEATFTLSALVAAQASKLLTGFVWRGDDGQAPADALVADCPHCVRPFMVAAQSFNGWRFVRLFPVRDPVEARRWREEHGR